MGFRPGTHIHVGQGLALMLILVLTIPIRTTQRLPLVLAVYVASHGWRGWTERLCDAPVIPYTSADEMTLERHVRQAKEVGIDGFAVLWWGPDRVNNPTEANLSPLMGVAEAAAFRVSVILDLTHPGLATTEAVEAAMVALGTRHMQHRAYLRLGGRPVVFLRGASRISLPAWEALRNRLDPRHAQIWIAEEMSPEGLHVFDGFFLFEPMARDALEETLQQTGRVIHQWGISHGGWRYWVAPVIPGYGPCDEAHQAPETLVEREDGSVYRLQWAAAMASDPDWILLRSFNEWECCTQVEPSLTYGDLYLNMTREMVDRYLRRPDELQTPAPIQLTPEVPTLETGIPTSSGITPTPPPVTSPGAPPTTVVPRISALPTPTRFSLPTPTPTSMWVVPSPARPEADASEPSYRATAPVRRSAPMPSSAPRSLPVEGGKTSRCLWLPVLMIALALWRGRRV